MDQGVISEAMAGDTVLQEEVLLGPAPWLVEARPSSPMAAQSTGSRFGTPGRSGLRRKVGTAEKDGGCGTSSRWRQMIEEVVKAEAGVAAATVAAEAAAVVAVEAGETLGPVAVVMAASTARAGEIAMEVVIAETVGGTEVAATRGETRDDRLVCPICLSQSSAIRCAVHRRVRKERGKEILISGICTVHEGIPQGLELVDKLLQGLFNDFVRLHAAVGLNGENEA